jgi:hypothetical protein
MMMESLQFVVSWLPPDVQARRVTTACLSVRIGQRTIWPVDGAGDASLEIQADDLLSYLTEFWKPLILRQTYPIASLPGRPSLLRSEAEKRWDSEPEETIEREDALITAFEEAHDVSRCFAGLFDLPPLWLVRQGDRMLVETKSALRNIAFDEARTALTAAGDEIASHLKAADEERWSDLLTAWQARDEGDPAVLLAWATSLDRNVAQSFVTDGVLTPPCSVTEAANDDDELRIAARMASALPQEQIRQIITLVQGIEKHEARLLDDLGADVRAHIAKSFSGRPPFEQGEAAANFVRARLNLQNEEQVDVFGAVEGLGVSVHPKSVEPSTLTAVEVLHSRMPLEIERRAKAFAGEFLLPGHVAAELWQRAKSPRSLGELDKFIGELSRDFGVTKNVVAWKLEHGLHKNDIDLRVLLDAVAPNR